MSIAYNLSDISLFYTDSSAYMQHLTETECQRIYIGSYFCGKYFMRSVQFFMNNLFFAFREKGLKVTLVVPSVTEHELNPVKQTIQSFFTYCSECSDEIVVNDYGMLSFAEDLKKQFPMEITAGRIFFKNFRDPRYPDHEKETTTLFFPALLSGKVSAIESDQVSKTLDFREVPENISIHVHYPYTYVSCGQNCEFAAASQPDGNRFVGSPRCGLSCMRGYMETQTDTASFLLVGKGVYTKSPNPVSFSRKPERYIYWPADEWIRQSDSTEKGIAY